jgi:hypothetical protein
MSSDAKARIETRIKCLTEFREILEVIGISKEYGSGLDEAMRNEIAFLRDLIAA